jgi:hypothetical protein
MAETAHRLYGETSSQSGAPALTMMQSILEKMQPMDFIVSREAAEFAAEAYIHHMCTHARRRLHAGAWSGPARGRPVVWGGARCAAWHVAKASSKKRRRTPDLKRSAFALTYSG